MASTPRKKSSDDKNEAADSSPLDNPDLSAFDNIGEPDLSAFDESVNLPDVEVDMSELDKLVGEPNLDDIDKLVKDKK